MNNRPPLGEALDTPVISNGWSNWFTQVFVSLPWKVGFNKVFTLTFGLVPAQSQLSLTVTVAGVRLSDSVMVAAVNDVSGIVFTGTVTAPNTVTVYAKNFSSASVNTGSRATRIIVLQN